MGPRDYIPYELFFKAIWPGDLKIEKVIFNYPATIVFWNDGTKTVVKCQDEDTWDPEKGIAMAVVKKTIGLNNFYKAMEGKS